MVDPIDEYMVQALKDYDGHPLVNVSTERFKLEGDEEEKAHRERFKQEFAPLCSLIKDILGDRVEKARGNTQPHKLAQDYCGAMH